MKKSIYLLLSLTIFLANCETNNEDPVPEAANMTITVYSAVEWSPENPQSLCSGAVVTLVSATTSLTETTNDEGKAVFANFEAGIYTIQVTKGNQSNIINKDNSGKGFVAIGIFQSQAEIEAYTDYKGDLLQPDAQPGELKILDLNNDSRIDGMDRVSVTYYNPFEDVNADGIINEDDKVVINSEGDMGYHIRELDMDVYIGN